MANTVENLSHTTHKNNADKAHAATQSIRTTKAPMINETIINNITGYDNNLAEKLEQLEREAEIQAKQIELNGCLEYAAQLVEFFKRTVILSELQCQNGWHNDAQHHLQPQKEVISNSVLEGKVEKIAMNKGLTKEQWKCLLYLALNIGDGIEITKVTKKHLHKVHDMVSRLLEGDEQNAVFALINAIEKYISENQFAEK